MKGSARHVAALHKLVKRLRRSHGQIKNEDLSEPLEELVRAILWRGTTEARASAALRALMRPMVDYNELRVTPPPEIQELISGRVPLAREKSQDIPKALNWLFARFNSLELTGLRERNKNELKEIFRRVEGLDAYSSAAVLLMSFGVHAVPLDERMLEYLKQEGAIDPAADLHKAQAFLERHIRAEQARQFFLMLRKHVENRSPGAERKKAAPKKRGVVKKPSAKKAAKRKAAKTIKK